VMGFSKQRRRPVAALRGLTKRRMRMADVPDRQVRGTYTLPVAPQAPAGISWIST